MTRRTRVAALAAIAALCLLAAIGYVALAARRSDVAGQAQKPDFEADRAAAIRARPHLMFLESQGDADRRVAVAALAEDARAATELRCQRVHMAAGRGLCVGGDGLGPTVLFDDALQPRQSLSLGGIPSRARVAPDGRYGAVTMFVTGHSYLQAGFSTQTTLIDMESGANLGDLEQFEVVRDGARIQAPDFNFWGVTFARDSNRFYATLGTAGRFYLVEGDVAARQLRVLRDGVECPSLSPDNTRLVYKKRLEPGAGRQVRWRLHVLDVATLVDTPLGEERSVDDQVEWLDEDHLVYFLPDEGPPTTIRPDLWLLPVAGTAPAGRIAIGAFSPVVIR